MTLSDLLTREQAAQYIGVRKRTLAARAHHGRFGLDKFLAARTVNTGASNQR